MTRIVPPSWTGIVLGAVLTLAWAPSVLAPEQSGLRAVWLGQDGHDYCQTAAVLGPNDIQDLHVRLEGLRADGEVQALLVTRRGGGAWAVADQRGHWRGHLIRTPGATSADLFLEPSHDEPTCVLDLELRYRDGAVIRCTVTGGPSDPNRFMPAAVPTAQWVGQDGHDWTGPGPGVGPDGFVDARIDLRGLSTKLTVGSLQVTGPGGAAWEYGLNPDFRANAELLRDPKDPAQGSLYFGPDHDLRGQTLTLKLTYDNGRHIETQVVAGATDPARRMVPPPPITLSPHQLTATWRGQDGQSSERGDVHVTIAGLPADAAIVAAALSDPVGGYWIYRRTPQAAFYPPAGNGDLSALPLRLQRAERATTADLFFPPYRNETDSPLVLRLVYEEGQTVVLPLRGGAGDAYQRGPLPAASAIDAKPGDDLHALVAQFGTVRLGPGRYVLRRPLALPRPVTLTGPAEAVLEFTQSADEPAWTGAVLLGASNTTLAGFTVRFAAGSGGPGFRWAANSPIGTAIIRTFDGADRGDPKVNLVLTKLDLEAAPPPLGNDPKQPPEAPYLARLAGATSGKIIGNRFRAGTVDVANGPWLIQDNQHLGPASGTVAWDAFGGHWLHDFTLERNQVRAAAGGGKMWRFLSMNQRGERVVIRDNTVTGVGMRDDDTIPNPNAPEILLTESYRLAYEGQPAALSGDGRVLHVPMVMHGVVRPGSLVSILTGPHAGRYFRIAQPLTPTAFLMAEPLPAGDYVISVAHGFADGVIQRNRIDVRGGASAVVVLAGNHWNFQVRDNELLGGGEGLRLQSTPTEAPLLWGWSHTPFFDLACEGNTIAEARRGVSVDVYSDRHNKSFAGRTYLTGTFCRNRLSRTPESSRPAPAGASAAPVPAVHLGASSGRDPQQMRLRVEGNTTAAGPGAATTTPLRLRIQRSILNGEAVTERTLDLPLAP